MWMSCRCPACSACTSKVDERWAGRCQVVVAARRHTRPCMLVRSLKKFEMGKIMDPSA